MTYLPTPHVIGHTAWVEDDGEDSHGNPLEGWASPVEVHVYGWAKPTSTEPKLAGHDRVVVDLEVFVPPDFDPGPYDVLTVQGLDYSIEGEPEDYTHGPFGWEPGRVINARRVGG